MFRWTSCIGCHSCMENWRSTARPRNSNIAPNSNHALSFVSQQALIAAANIRSMLYVQDVVTSTVVESSAAAIPFTDPSGGVSIAVAGVATVQPYQLQEVGTVCRARQNGDAGSVTGMPVQLEWPNDAASFMPQVAGHSPPCFSHATEAPRSGWHQDSMLCNDFSQDAVKSNQHDSLQPPSTQQMHCSASQQAGEPQTPHENSFQGSGSAPPSTDSSFNPSSEFQAVYGGFYGGFYGATKASGVSNQAGSSCSNGAPGPPSGDPDEEVLILQEVTEEEVGTPCSCPTFFNTLEHYCVCFKCLRSVWPPSHKHLMSAGKLHLMSAKKMLHHGLSPWSPWDLFVHDAWSEGGCATQAEVQQYDVQIVLLTPYTPHCASRCRHSGCWLPARSTRRWTSTMAAPPRSTRCTTTVHDMVPTGQRQLR